MQQRTRRMTSNLPEIDEIDLIVFDFDGVMTDNRVYVFEDGREAVQCNRGDGLGMDMLRSAGVPMILLSTETNPVVTARAQKLQLEVYQGVGDKASLLSSLLMEREVQTDRVMYVGNDLNDLESMRMIGWPAAPADAARSVLAMARFITEARGGEGVVRELAETLLRNRSV